MAGGWLGGSVVGLGGSVCTVGTGPEEALLGSFRDWTLGGDGGMWEGGGGMGSAKAGGTPAFALSSPLSSFWTVEGAVTGAAGGSTVGDSGWLGGEGSTEWRLVTGVNLFGGAGGERLAGTGTTTMPLPGWENSAVSERNATISNY